MLGGDETSMNGVFPGSGINPAEVAGSLGVW